MAELGFGTGLNCLALAQVARMPVRMTSFEAFPMDVAQLQRAHAAFPELDGLAQQLRASWGQRLIRIGNLQLELVIGDVAQTLPRWQGQADAWFLDGFSPARNPEMWSDEVMAQVGRHSAADASLATYTAAGHVRRALQQAGFQVQRRPGFGHKRHMTVGRMEAGRMEAGRMEAGRMKAGRMGALAPRRDGPLDGGRNGAPPVQR